MGQKQGPRVCYQNHNPVSEMGTGTSTPRFAYLEILGTGDSEVPVIYSFT
jgi:hypothetical protein